MAKQDWKPGNMLYPVPAVMVSCARQEEKPNIITVAWAGTVCSDPAMVSVSIRPERYSHSIIEETKEFVINLVTKELAFATDYCGVRSGRDIDKFKELGLTPQPSKIVKAPGIAESPLIAEIVNVTVDDSFMDEKGKFNLNDAGLVAYSHGEYFELGEKLGKFGDSVQKKGK